MAASSPASTEAPTGAGTTTEPRRYLALDAYRGFIMLLLASEGFRLLDARRAIPPGAASPAGSITCPGRAPSSGT